MRILGSTTTARATDLHEADAQTALSSTPVPKANDTPRASVQVTGELGSPSTTTTIPGDQLPPPDPKFGGVIKEDALEAKPSLPPRVTPPQEAGNRSKE